MTRPLKNLSEIAVIGGGLAGLSAARHAARLGRLVTLFEGTGLYGGQVATIGEVEGLPLPGTLSGQDLAVALLTEAQKVGVRVIEAAVACLELGEKIVLTDHSGEIHHPDAVIIASGASLRPLGVPGEEEYLGRGVSRCATCDGGFYRDKDVVVVGGGDGAVHEALTLAKTSATVTVVARSPLKAKREYIDKLDARHNVRFVWDSEVAEVLGEDGVMGKVTGVRVRDVRDGTTSEIACAGVFPFIGVEPNTAFAPPHLLTPSGHVSALGGFTTADPRVFAIGAVRAEYGGTAVEAMAEGYQAATAVSRLLERRTDDGR
jgi:thioredoxin reductase (NADPH)